MRLPDGVRRLLRLGGRGRRSRDLDEELAFHREQTERKLRAAGLDAREARAEARRRFGDEAAYRRALETIDGKGRIRREGVEMLDVMERNVTFALRGIRRAPGFAAAVVGILALGIGANAVMFGVVDRILLSPPQHLRDADRIRHVHLERDRFDGSRRTDRWLTYPDYADLLQVDAFTSVAAYRVNRLTLGSGEGARQLAVGQATASLFTLTGVAPALGRLYGAADDATGAPPVVVLAHEFWESHFGGDPGVLGRNFRIGEGSYEVVGVAPPGFTGVELTPVDAWVPLVRSQEIEDGDTGWRDADNARNYWWLSAAVRLGPGATVASAADQATAAHRAGRAPLIEQERYDARAAVVLAPVIAARGPTPAAEARVAAWLAGVSLAVLLIACFNVANLLLARATRWRRELAVRTALGVSRGRLLGQLLTESLVLAGLGAAGAALVAHWGAGVVHGVLLPNVAFTDTALRGRLVAFLGVATLLTTVLAGLLPALRASRADVAEALRAGGRGAGVPHSRTRVALLVGQAALSVVLLIGAGLFVASLQRARATDLGFDADRVATVRPQWVESLPGGARLQVFRAAQERVARLPGVQATALTYTIPFRSSLSFGRPRIPGRDSVPRHPRGGPYANKVTAGYFEAMGLSILRGRPLGPDDEAANAPPVAVVTESMARAYWPDDDALGACMLFGSAEEDPPCTTVVGVVENSRRQDLVEADPHFLYYVNQSHPGFRGPPQALVVRTTGPARDRLEALRAEFRATSPLVRFPDTRTLRQNVEPQLRSWLLGASMFSVFGLLALVVAAIGLYSVLAFDVALRQQEMGVRAALGAGASRLVGMVLRRALLLVTGGVALGMGAALAGARFVEPLLYEVSPTEPAVYAGVVAVLVATAALAGSLPAWRVARADPTAALQAE